MRTLEVPSRTQTPRWWELSPTACKCSLHGVLFRRRYDLCPLSDGHPRRTSSPHLVRSRSSLMHSAPRTSRHTPACSQDTWRCEWAVSNPSPWSTKVIPCNDARKTACRSRPMRDDEAHLMRCSMPFGSHRHHARGRRYAAGLLRCLAFLGSTSFPPKDRRLLAVFHVESRQFDHCTSIFTWCVFGSRLTCARQTTSDPLTCPRPCNDSHLRRPRTSRPGSLESLLPTNAVMLKMLNTIPTQSACICQPNARIPLTWSSGRVSQPEKTRTSPCAHSLLALRVAFTARRSRQENPDFSSWLVLGECTKTTSSIRECRNATEKSSAAKQGATSGSPATHIAIISVKTTSAGVVWVTSTREMFVSYFVTKRLVQRGNFL